MMVGIGVQALIDVNFHMRFTRLNTDLEENGEQIPYKTKNYERCKDMTIDYYTLNPHFFLFYYLRQP